MQYEKLVEISDRVLVSPRDIEQMLFILRGGPTKQIEIQRRLGFPKSAMQILPVELSNLITREGDRFSLRQNAQDEVDELQSRRAGFDAQVEARLSYAVEELKSVEQSRDRSYRNFDQFRAVPESTVAKVGLIYQRGDLESRDIILIGDNDLAAVAAGFTGVPKKITVLDIDKKILDLLEELNRQHSLNIETVCYNAKSPFPNSLKSQYSVAVTDPPYTPEGISLFVSRCIGALGRKNGVIYLSYGYSPRAAERALPIQDALTKMGLVIEEVKPGFTKYYAAQSIGSSSALYVCRMTPRSKPIISGKFTGDIYTKTRPK